MDIDMMILLRRMNNVFNQEIGQIKMYNYKDVINVDDKYNEFIGLRNGSYRVSKDGTQRGWNNLVNRQLYDACWGG